MTYLCYLIFTIALSISPFFSLSLARSLSLCLSVSLSLSDNIITSFNASVDNFVSKICKKYCIKNEQLKEWIYNVKRIFAKRVEFLLEVKLHLFKKNVSILKDKDIINYIEQLHKDFVICSIDKAANNYVIICKKFYVLTLMKELGIDPISYVCQDNITYQLVDLSENNIVQEHSKFLKEKFDIVVSKVNERIPRIFWNPKLHKNPYKARFIAGARNSSTKQLSVYLNRALAVFFFFSFFLLLLLGVLEHILKVEVMTHLGEPSKLATPILPSHT